jgi:outer membrane protein OmpA-like peptidoglycan-associated protein
MRFLSALLLAGLAAFPGLAWAGLPSGDEVSVNPPSGGGNVLLYPGGQYMRVVKPLLQPGETSQDAGPLRLHMPQKRAAAPASSATASSESQQPTPKPSSPPPRRVAAAPKPAPAPAKPAPAKPAPAKQTASAAPAQPQSSSSNDGYGIFAAPPGAGLITETPPASAPKSQPPRSEPSRQPATPKQQTAKAEPPARPLMAQEPPTPGLTKRSVILFSAGASDPARKALDSIKFLAGDLNSAMVNQGSRVQLLAYGGEKGDKSSDARRLSLKRALAIRQVLIDDGVPSERIDVRAMGGADDGGPADRVDVFVKT